MARPEFYTGEPVEPDDLWFRDDFIDLVWDKLQHQHVLVSAPRRTGEAAGNLGQGRQLSVRLDD